LEAWQPADIALLPYEPNERERVPTTRRLRGPTPASFSHTHAHTLT
jgi:hypothetical protein